MPPRPQRTPSEQIDTAVIAAALALIDRDGAEGFTVRALAREAGVAPMSIYNHFGDKNGVLDALWMQGYEILATLSSTSSSDPHDNLIAGARAYREFALTHQAHYTVMFIHRFVGYEPSAEAVYTAAKGFEVLSSQVEACQRAGYFVGRHYVDVAQQMWAAVHGYVTTEILGLNFASDREKVFLDFITSLVFGLSRPAP